MNSKSKKYGCVCVCVCPKWLFEKLGGGGGLQPLAPWTVRLYVCMCVQGGTSLVCVCVWMWSTHVFVCGDVRVCELWKHTYTTSHSHKIQYT